MEKIELEVPEFLRNRTNKGIKQKNKINKHSNIKYKNDKKRNIIKMIVGILTLVIVGLVIIFFTGLVTNKIEQDNRIKNMKFERIEVEARPGDTIWSIAKDFRPDDMYMADYMSKIYKENKTIKNLQIGQKVTVLKEVK